MIRIKAVDGQNLLDVCGLTTKQDAVLAAMEGCACCNAISIAEAKYDPEMHPNAIYNNNALIGFFMYQRAENQADTATICRFMVDDRFQKKGLEEKVLEHILRGFKIQGVRNVIFIMDHADENAGKLKLPSGFRFAGRNEEGKCCYKLELSL